MVRMSATLPEKPRLAAGMEASAFIRRAQAEGGFGVVLQKGDAERGALLLAIAERGVHVTCLAREFGPAGYAWTRVGPPAGKSEKLESFLQKRQRNDPDEWQIELDIPSAERFVAETSVLG